jgi:hypothetical protein
MNQLSVEFSLQVSTDQNCDYEITSILYDISYIHKLTVKEQPEYLKAFGGTSNSHSDIWQRQYILVLLFLYKQYNLIHISWGRNNILKDRKISLSWK